MSEFKLKAEGLKEDANNIMKLIEEINDHYTEGVSKESYIEYILEKLNDFKTIIEEKYGINVNDDQENVKKWRTLEGIIISKLLKTIEEKEVKEIIEEEEKKYVEGKIKEKGAKRFGLLNSIMKKIRDYNEKKYKVKVHPIGGRKSKLRRKKRANKKTMKRRR